ncbi:MAG TPA: carboxypeptidase-like regulatory domain-containing protein [Longimicrobium sp.]|nr:carboxypeptidase-like regulatory domain-containing protein [Longimicrobium sp.]
MDSTQPAMLVGTVISAATREPLPEVTVSACSSVLAGPEVVVTDALGNYQFAQLPQGTYTVKMTRDGYRPRVVDDVVLQDGRELRLNGELAREMAAATADGDGGGS